MSYIHKPHIQPLEHRTPFQLLHRHAQATPHKEAFIFRDAEAKRVAITFEEYEKKSEALATALLDLGLVRGDRVLLMLPTNEEFVYIHMALDMIGALAVVVEQDAYGLIALIKDLACIIADTDYSVHLNKEKTVQELRAVFKQGTLKAGVIVGHSKADDDLLTYPKVYAYEKLCDGSTRVNEESRARLEKAQAQVQFEDPIFVLFTSGSTGIPKPIQFTNQGFVNATRTDAHNMALDKDSIMFCDGPFDWITGMGGIGVVLMTGCTFVSFPPRLAFQGGLTKTILKIIEEERCSHAILLLYVLQDLVSSQEVYSIDLSQLVHCLTGGQPTSPALMKKLFSKFPHFRFHNLYGATETNQLATQVITKDSMDFLDNGVLEISAGFEVKIVQEDGHVAPINVPGELCARGNTVSFIHRDLIKGLEEPKSPEDVALGWHHMKDLASISPEGRLKLLGRMDNLIKCATESIPPIKIEQELQEHPNVDKVVAVGVPDKRLYQKICACIILKAGHHGNQEVLRAQFEEWYKDKDVYLCSNGLPIKPHCFVFFGDFPLTRTGKLDRKLLTDMAVKELGL